MTLLATIATQVGPVELHCRDGRFYTQRIVAADASGGTYVSKVLITRESAAEWYALAGSGSSVHQPFPAPCASIERKST